MAATPQNSKSGKGATGLVAWPPPWWKQRAPDEIFQLARFNNLLRRRKLPLNIPDLDEIMKGGLSSGLIYEFSGEAGAGKTQAVLSLIAQVLTQRCYDTQKGSLRKNAVYVIYTEGKFPVERLKEILSLKAQRFFKDEARVDAIGTASSEVFSELIEELLGQVYIEGILTEDDLYDILYHKLGKLLRRFDVQLLVIDSIAAIFRPLNEMLASKEGSRSRAEQLYHISSILRRVACESRCWIIITNQVSDSLSEEFEGQGFYSGCLEMRQKLPALGLVWSTCIDCRIILKKTSSKGIDKYSKTPGEHQVYETWNRAIQVDFAPNLSPSGVYPFSINPEGITGVSSRKFMFS